MHSIKRAGLWVYDCYELIFNHNKNPLKNIPDPLARMWIMVVLAWLWSITFGCLIIGSIVFAGLCMAAHFLLLCMVTLTVCVFWEADRRGDTWLLALRKK